MDILNTIEIINEAYEKTCNELNPILLSKNAKMSFTNAYCYEFYLILKHYFPKGELVMQKNNMHCAILIDNIIYDTTGAREDHCSFRMEKSCDLENIYKNFGFFSYFFRDAFYKNVFHMMSVVSKNSVKILKKSLKV